MNNSDKKCDECGELLKETQYASGKKEGERGSGNDDGFVCRNSTKCAKAEKEV